MGIAIVAVLIGVVVAGGAWLAVRDESDGTVSADTEASGAAGSAPVATMMVIGPDEARARVDELVARAPDPQKAVLADGAVSRSEYEDAVRSTVACFEAGFGQIASSPTGPIATLTMDPIVVSPDGFEITYSYGVDTVPGATTQQDQAAVAALEENCHRTMQQNIKDVYQTNLLADPGYVARTANAFTACARDAGVTSFGTTPEAMMTTLQQTDPPTRAALRPCFDQAPSVAVALGSKVAP